jgi:signal recognition particle subunit SEC65
MKRKRKKNPTNLRAPRIRERKKGAAGAREKWGTTHPRICRREGGPIYLLREERRSAGREERRKEKKDEPEGGAFQNVGREEGASKREVREKAHPRLWRERDGVASCRRRRVRGGDMEGAENDLENFQ